MVKRFEYYLWHFCQPFICLAKIKLLESFLFVSDCSVKRPISKCLRLIGTRSIRVSIVVPKLHESILLLTRSEVRLGNSIVPNFLTPHFAKKQDDNSDHHNAKKHSAPKLDVTFKSKFCAEDFPRFYEIRQHKKNKHGVQI